MSADNLCHPGQMRKRLWEDGVLYARPGRDDRGLAGLKLIFPIPTSVFSVLSLSRQEA
jgi:hypothetical protein